MQLDCGMWYAAYDYVRLTAKDDEYGKGPQSVYGKASLVCSVKPEDGGRVWKPWFWLGYYGETDNVCSYGSGVQGSILQVSGAQAQEVRRHNPPYDGVPRVDIQVTMWLKRDVPYVARYAAQESVVERARTHGGKWRINVRDGFGDGDTCYIGSRQSDVFIRIYDKWRESKLAEEYRYAWRFEIELSGAPAQAVWAGAHTAEPGPETVAGWVRWHLARRGVSLPDTVSSVLASTPPSVPRVTDNDRRLAWLRNQVRPSIDKMVSQGVSLEHIAQALGLDFHESARTWAKLSSKGEREGMETE